MEEEDISEEGGRLIKRLSIKQCHRIICGSLTKEIGIGIREV